MKDTTILDDKVFEQLNMTDLTAEEKSNFSKNFFVALNARVNTALVEVFLEEVAKADEQFEKLKAEIMSGAEQLSEGDEEVDTEPTQDVNPFFVDSKVPAPQPPPAITSKV